MTDQTKQIILTHVCLGLLMFWLGWITIDTNQKIEQVDKAIISLEMYDLHNAAKVSSVGVYFHKDRYYCISTKYRAPNYIEQVDLHEQFHDLINSTSKMKEHFCEDVK